MIRSRLFSIPLKYGMVGGIIIVVPFLLLEWLGQKPLINLNTLVLEGILMFMFILFAVKEFRYANSNNLLKFWEGMTAGFVVYLTIAIIYSLFLWIYMDFIDTDYLSDYSIDIKEYLNESIAKAKNSKDADILIKQLKNIGKTTVLDLVWDGFVKKILMGIGITPIIALILRKSE